MNEKANVVSFKRTVVSQDMEKRLQLDSGRQIVVSFEDKEELIRIFEPQGEISMTIRMTDSGPVFTLRGAQLKIESTEAISLEAKKIAIHAQEEVSIDSEGRMKIDSAKKIDIHSDDDIRIEGRMIHLN